MKLTDKFFSLFKRDAILFFATLLTGIVIARQLGPEMMGIWTILLLIPGYAEAFGRFQFDVSAVYFIGKKKADIGEVTFILHLVALIAALIIGCAFVVGFEWFYQRLFANIEADVRTLAFVVLVIYPLRLIYINYSYLLIAHEDIKAYNMTVIIQALLTASLSIFLIMALEMGIYGALVGSLTGLSISIIYAAYKVQRIARLRFSLNVGLFVEMTKYAVHYYFSGLIGYFQNNVTSLIAAVFIGPAQVAFYAVGKSICEVSTRMVPVAVNTALFPHVARLNDTDESGGLVARLFRVTLLILIGSSVCLSLLIKPVVYVLYGSPYYPLIIPFLIMIPGVVLVQSALVFSTFFSGLGRPDLLPKASLFPLLLQAVLSALMIPELGIIGAAQSFSLSALVLFLIQTTFFLRLSKVGIGQLVPGTQDVRSVWGFVAGKLVTLVPGWRKGAGPGAGR